MGKLEETFSSKTNKTIILNVQLVYNDYVNKNGESYTKIKVIKNPSFILECEGGNSIYSNEVLDTYLKN